MVAFVKSSNVRWVKTAWKEKVFNFVYACICLEFQLDDKGQRFGCQMYNKPVKLCKVEPNWPLDFMSTVVASQMHDLFALLVASEETHLSNPKD